MKTTLFLLILFSFTNISIAIAQWELCNNGLYSDKIWCFIVDENNTYAGGFAGIFMTTDNGDNWITKNKGLKSWVGIDIESLAINGNNIFAGTWLDGIFLSTDKGENWVRKSNGLPIRFENGNDTAYGALIYDIKISGNNIFAGTNVGIYISTDNGDNWTEKNNGLTQLDSIINVHSIAANDNNIFLGTRFGVFISTDNGDTWVEKNKGIENMDVYTLAINENNIYAGTWYGLFLSTNNGENWNKIGVVDSTIVDILIVKENYIIAGGHGLYFTKDNGNSWTAINSGLPDLGESSAIINGKYIFACTLHGIFRAKLSDLGITDVKETEHKNGNTIYPNPASDEFRLRFHAPFETTVQLNVFDLLGNCVLRQKLHSTEGMNEKSINCEKLPQGYYYVKININEIVETVPLVVVK